MNKVPTTNPAVRPSVLDGRMNELARSKSARCLSYTGQRGRQVGVQNCSVAFGSPQVMHGFIVGLLAAVLTAGAASAQDRYPVERISLEQGLSQSIVKCILKDRRGFMWFGTESGLNRYDGYSFKVYKQVPFDRTSISNNDILALAEDSSGMIWIGTSIGGLNMFDPRTGKFTRYLNRPDDSTSLSYNTVTGVFVDTRNTIWAATAVGGLDHLDRKTGRFHHHGHDPDDPGSLSSNALLSALEDESGTIWITSDAGLNRYDRKRDRFNRIQYSSDAQDGLNYPEVLSVFQSRRDKNVLWLGTGDRRYLSGGGGLNRMDLTTGKVTHYTTAQKSFPISSNIVGQVIEDTSGILWIGTAAGINRFDPSTGKFTAYLPEPSNPKNLRNVVRAMILDVKGDIWVVPVANNGIYQFRTRTRTFVHYEYNENDPQSLSADGIASVYLDPSGVLWLGTNMGGLSKIDLYSKKFRMYASRPNDPNSLTGNLVRSMTIDHRGQLWVGTGSGLNRYSADRRTITRFTVDRGRVGGLTDNRIWALHCDRSGTVWIGTVSSGLYSFEPSTGQFKRYQSDPSGSKAISSNFIRAIFEDREGRLWIGTETGGLNYFDRERGIFYRYQPRETDRSSISARTVRAIAQDREGVLWVATFGGGLNKVIMPKGDAFDPARVSFQRFRHNPADPASISQDLLQSLAADSKGAIWIGTFGGGLDRFDPRNEAFAHFTEENSDLPNNVVYGVLCDASDNVWMSSNRGITRYNPADRVFTTFDTHDGLQSMEFNGQACFRSPAGEMFFGGINGMNSFFPDSIAANPVVPNVAISDFRLFDKPVPIGDDSPLRVHILETKEITLKHWQNDLSFGFVALHYNRPGRNRYSFMLQNYDKDWRDAGGGRTATYTNLDPGEYVFRVRGSNDAGVWNLEGASVRIVVLPPWWQTGAAKAAYVFFTILLLYIGYRIQHRIVIKSERARARFREMELRAKMAEAQARAIQAENDRKTHELEEARKLQLSMLPKVLPVVPDLEIAVYMQTATEVGGDYYDFHLDKENGALTIVVGDATGHGLSAGTMVSVIKSLFIANNGRLDMQEFFQSCTSTIKQLRLGNLYMALMLARIEKNVLTASAAGMPPIYIYRQARKEVDVIRMKGMPLGAFNEFVYEDTRVQLESGDTILLLSDGLPELFNDEREMFDYHRVTDTFAHCADQPAQAVVDCLIRAADDWRKDRPPNDDITFVVVKVR